MRGDDTNVEDSLTEPEDLSMAITEHLRKALEEMMALQEELSTANE